MNSETKKGMLLIAANAVVAGIFPILMYGGIVPLSPLWHAAICTAISIVPFAVTITIRKKWPELKNLEAVKYSIISATFIGVIYYALVFVGGHYAGPESSALLLLFELVTSILFLLPLKAERVTPREALGALLITASSAIIVWVPIEMMGLGQWLILSAALFTPIGNVYAKKARKLITTESLFFIRAVLSSIALAILALSIEGTSSLEGLSTRSLMLISVNGIFVFALGKLLWTEGLQHLKVSTALAIQYAVSPATTFIISILWLQSFPSISQWVALVIAVAGVLVLSLQKKP